MNVIQALEDVGVDLIEISGGTYEKLAMMGQAQFPQKESTRQREAYFLEYVRKVRLIVSIPIMLTGGFRSVNAMVQAISEGSVDVIGLARPLAIAPDFPMQLLTNRTENITLQPQLTPNTQMDEGMLEIIWYTQQIHQLAGINKRSL
jgi:2,4-dienoyl-CoA reductase-like NADH-dependent reductase (Old Yellow Enzyme family)